MLLVYNICVCLCVHTDTQISYSPEFKKEIMSCLIAFKSAELVTVTIFVCSPGSESC